MLKNTAFFPNEILLIVLTGMLCCCTIFTSLKAQEIRELKKGEYIILYPDGTLSAYDVLNPVHKRLLKDFEEGNIRNKNLKQKSEVTTPLISDPEKRKLHIAEMLRMVSLELEKGIKVDTAFQQRRTIEKRFWKEQKNRRPDFAKSKSLAKAVRKARSVEKKAIREFQIVSKSSAHARTELKKYQFDVSGQPPYQPLYKKKKLVFAVSSSVNYLGVKIAAKLKPVKRLAIKTADSSSRIIEKSKVYGTRLLNYKKTAPTPIRAEIVKAQEEVYVLPDKIIRLKPVDDVMQNPPLARCKVIFEGKDEFSGKYRKELSPVTVFSYTDVSMKKFYEKDDFLTCEAYFSVIENSYKYLTFQFTMASENVQTSYGWLEKDNLIQIRFLDGSTLNLYNTRTDRGTVNTATHSTSYRAYCVIGSREEKMLLNAEADAIRVQWSTGTEDYEIFDVDIFSDQVRCLTEKTK